MDLMSHKIRMHLESENRKVMTMLDQSDDRLDMLFKHYEMIQSYQHAFDELIKKAQSYRRQEEFEGSHTIKTSELTRVQNNLDQLRERADAFNKQFTDIKSTVIQTFGTQIQEYMTSVDVSPAVGVDRNFAPTFKNMHNKIDGLIEAIDKMKTTTLEFKAKYEENLDKKEKFYEEQKKHENENKQKGLIDDGSSVDPSLRLDEKVVDDI